LPKETNWGSKTEEMTFYTSLIQQNHHLSPTRHWKQVVIVPTLLKNKHVPTTQIIHKAFKKKKVGSSDKATSPLPGAL